MNTERISTLAGLLHDSGNGVTYTVLTRHRDERIPEIGGRGVISLEGLISPIARTPAEVRTSGAKALALYMRRAVISKDIRGLGVYSHVARFIRESKNIVMLDDFTNRELEFQLPSQEAEVPQNGDNEIVSEDKYKNREDLEEFIDNQFRKEEFIGVILKNTVEVTKKDGKIVPKPQIRGAYVPFTVNGESSLLFTLATWQEPEPAQFIFGITKEVAKDFINYVHKHAPAREKTIEHSGKGESTKIHVANWWDGGKIELGEDDIKQDDDSVDDREDITRRLKDLEDDREDITRRLKDLEDDREDITRHLKDLEDDREDITRRLKDLENKKKSRFPRHQ